MLKCVIANLEILIVPFCNALMRDFHMLFWTLRDLWFQRRIHIRWTDFALLL